jgi:integrase
MDEIEKTSASVTKKTAIMVKHLVLVRTILVAHSPADIKNWIILVISFFALLRISEVLKLRWMDLVKKGEVLWLHIASSKKQREWQWVPVVIQRNSLLCPVTALGVWAKACSRSGNLSEDQGIFRYTNMSKVTSEKTIQVTQGRVVCKELLERAGLNAKELITHGARRGGYQLCEHTLVAEGDAQHMGRWMQAETAKEYSGGHLAARLRVAKVLAEAVSR